MYLHNSGFIGICYTICNLQSHHSLSHPLPPQQGEISRSIRSISPRTGTGVPMFQEQTFHPYRRWHLPKRWERFPLSLEACQYRHLFAGDISVHAGAPKPLEIRVVRHDSFRDTHFGTNRHDCSGRKAQSGLIYACSSLFSVIWRFCQYSLATTLESNPVKGGIFVEPPRHNMIPKLRQERHRIRFHPQTASLHQHRRRYNYAAPTELGQALGTGFLQR